MNYDLLSKCNTQCAGVHFASVIIVARARRKSIPLPAWLRENADGALVHFERVDDTGRAHVTREDGTQVLSASALSHHVGA